MTSDKSQFWVVFDTCTRPEYYQDLHNLLALPRGGVMRYEYRTKYWSEQALESALRSNATPILMLFVYAQWFGYRRGENPPASPVLDSEILWIGTRIARMQLLPKKSGNNLYFDFSVMGYPRNNHSVLMGILDPLIKAHESPFDKWVSTSSETSLLTSLNQGRDDENWQSIIDTLGVLPSQFVDDVFWRMKGFYSGAKGDLVVPKIRKHSTVVGGRTETSKVDTVYELEEGHPYKIAIVSHTPSPTSIQSSAPAKPQGIMEIGFKNDGALIPLGNAALEIRPYSEKYIEFRTKRADEIVDQEEALVISLRHTEGAWPNSPRLEVRVAVKKQLWTLVLGVILGILGLAAWSLAPSIWDTDPALAVVSILMGVVMAMSAWALLFGKIQFRF